MPGNAIRALAGAGETAARSRIGVALRVTNRGLA